MTARLMPIVARFKQSDAEDIVANRVYVEEAPSQYTLDLLRVGEVPIPPVGDDGYTRIDLAALANVASRDFDGTYDVYITAVDDAGNESAPLVIPQAVFDLVPPGAPTDGTIETS